MKRLYPILLALWPIASASADYAWTPIQHQCRDEIMAEQCHYGNCYQLWKPIAKCTVQRAMPNRFPASTIDQCISIIEAERTRRQLCTGCGDPILDTFSCVQGRSR